MMSKQVFDALPSNQKDILMSVGADMEKFGTEAAKADDKAAAAIYSKAGSKVIDLDNTSIAKWQEIARQTAWKDFAERNETCAAMLKAAEKLL